MIRINVFKSIIAVTMAILISCMALTACSSGNSSEYESKLFDTSYVHEINITIDKNDLEKIYASPMDKTKYSANITIDGETVNNAAISTKGANSLRDVATDDSSNRYSYKIVFDKYVDGQTYYGLDKLLLQNNICDPTSLKSFTAFEMFRQMGVATPLASYALVTINGKDASLYCIMEAVDSSFMARNNISDSSVYKPDWTEEIKGTDTKHERNQVEKWIDCTKVDHGTYLKYSDDKAKNYADIFENAVRDNVSSDEESSMITALQGLSEGKDLEKYLDTDEIITYFAVHNFILNYDSYTGGLCHNYYVCDTDGKLSMMPWDYDRGFSPFIGWGNVDTEEYYNTGIDTPLMYCSEEDRPMWTWIQSNEEYKKKYHDTMGKLIDYCENDLQNVISNQYEIIRPYLKKDETTKFTVAECDYAYNQLKMITDARTKSIRKQIDGKLSTVTDKQNKSDRIDCTGIYPMTTSSGLEGDSGK